MKPFNLEEARKGAPVCTRNGTPAEFITYAPQAPADSQVIVLIGDRVMLYFADGHYYNDQKGEIDDDLMLAARKRIVWVNFYENSTLSLTANVHATEEGANRAVGQHDSRLGCKAYPVEIDV